jgi:hypothetical protein
MKIVSVLFFLLLTKISLGNVVEKEEKGDGELKGYLYDKISDKLSRKLTHLMNKRSVKYPQARFLSHDSVDMFKTVNVHKFNPPYAILNQGNKFKLLRHAFPTKKTSLNLKPVLFERFPERKPNLQ